MREPATPWSHFLRTLWLGHLLLIASVNTSAVGWGLRRNDDIDAVKIHGQFLHITDLHPDPFYKPGSKESTMCHGKRIQHEIGPARVFRQRRAGPIGLATSDCDSPFELINATFSYLKENWAEKVDFVVWTGDNARHDNDNRLPRSMKQIMDLNRYISDQMLDTFGKTIPIIPSIGNNDIYPHNVMSAGPNIVTNSFAKLWKHYIPEEQYHLFQTGAYFTKEVIPGVMAVISLNTLYFYDSNKIVDGCEKKSEPGTVEMRWLEVQLSTYRARQMQVHITGHVPPSRANYSPSCFKLYRDLSLHFQDTILGHHFGHMNVDHFFLLGDETEEDKTSDGEADTGVRSGSLAEELLHSFDAIPRHDKIDLSDYAIIHVNPSVVPTFLPSLRIWRYNSSSETRYIPSDIGTWTEVFWNAYRTGIELFSYGRAAQYPLMRSNWLSLGMEHTHRGYKNVIEIINERGNSREHGHKKKRFPKKQRHTSPLSPARSNRFLTPLDYTQIFLPLANGSSERSSKRLRVGETTIGDRVRDSLTQQQEITSREVSWEVEYTTSSPGPGEYNLRDGTIGSWLELGRSISRDARRFAVDWPDCNVVDAAQSLDNLWKVFGERM